jgi:hypothetical protein
VTLAQVSVDIHPRFRPEGFQLYLVAISQELGDTARRQPRGLERAGRVRPLTAASAA